MTRFARGSMMTTLRPRRLAEPWIGILASSTKKSAIFPPSWPALTTLILDSVPAPAADPPANAGAAAEDSTGSGVEGCRATGVGRGTTRCSVVCVGRAGGGNASACGARTGAGAQAASSGGEDSEPPRASRRSLISSTRTAICCRNISVSSLNEAPLKSPSPPLARNTKGECQLLRCPTSNIDLMAGCRGRRPDPPTLLKHPRASAPANQSAASTATPAKIVEATATRGLAAVLLRSKAATAADVMGGPGSGVARNVLSNNLGMAFEGATTDAAHALGTVPEE
mmetsp:Transcript_58523/g.148528  ORF Transcript_58523/g.148528 Transcript_58523/m.148528 type:complete len:283 (-) Transcript_58523:60-908(-)